MFTRREMLQSAAALAAVPTLFATAKAQEKSNGFTLPKLPYAYDALEPHIDAETMKIHHGKHHQAYVNNLNKALAGMPDWLTKPIEEVIDAPEGVAGEGPHRGPQQRRRALNHSFFWHVMTKPGGRRRRASCSRRSSRPSAGWTGSRRRSPRRRPGGSAAGGRGWCPARRSRWRS